jgi:hypothetical protein
MRVIRTIILRLLIDTDQPHSLHGVLQTVGGSDLHSFTDDRSLLALLHRLGCSESEPAWGGECQDIHVEVDD